MKIRHPLVIRWLAFFGSLLLRLCLATLRFRCRALGPRFDPWADEPMPQAIACLWHENILLPAYRYGHKDFRVLVSQHADGEIIAQVLGYMGFGTIRGSTTRGGIQAVRKMIAASADKHLVLIPDGPRGPRRRFELGTVYLASRTGLPIVCVGVGYANPWRLPTWDRFAIPKPFSSAALVTSPPLRVPANLRKEELEVYRRRAEEELEHVTRVAQQLAEGKRPREQEGNAQRRAA